MSNALVQLAEINTYSTKKPDNGCDFCGKDGLMILPLRYGALSKSTDLPRLPGHAGNGVTDLPLKYSDYTIRTTRSGYFYLLINRKGTLRWQCYASNAQGYLARFAQASPPLMPPEFNCDPSKCGLNASMMSIEEADDVSAAYLLFTPSPLTVPRLKDLANEGVMNDFVSKGQVTRFHPAAWVKAQKDKTAPDGDSTQHHCLDVVDVAKSVAEFVLAGTRADKLVHRELFQSLLKATFPLMHEPHQEEVNLTVALSHLNRWPAVLSYLRTKRGVAVIARDPIGITQELNDHRNDGFNLVDDYLESKDTAGIPHRRKYTCLMGIREVEQAFANGMASDMRNLEHELRLNVFAKHSPIFPDDEPAMANRKRKFNNAYTHPDRNDWARDNPGKMNEMKAQIDQLERDQPQRLVIARREAAQRWQRKYASLLDTQAIARIDEVFKTASKRALDAADQRVEDHLTWAEHDRFIDAFEFYDRADPISGHHFAGEAACCFFGMTGVPKAAAKVDDWLDDGPWVTRANRVKRNNIYLRSLMLNQRDIEQEAATALADAAAAVGHLEEVSSIPGKLIYKFAKNLITFFQKADSAWDEALRNQGQVAHLDKDGKPKKDIFGRVKQPFYKTKEGAKLLQLSEITRSFGRASITGVEVKIAGRLSTFLLGRMGEIADKINVDHVLYQVAIENPHDPKNKYSATNTTGDRPTRDSHRPPLTQPEDSPVIQQRMSKATNTTWAELDPMRFTPTSDPLNDREFLENQKPQYRLMRGAEEMHQRRLAGIVKPIEEEWKKPETNNYHQVRIGVVLASMETCALIGKIKEMIKKGRAPESKEVWEATANLLSVTSIGHDIAYGMVKSVREVAVNATVKSAGDVLRGGLKLRGGLLSAGAGMISIALDYGNLMQELDGNDRVMAKTLLVLKIFHGIANTGFSAAAAYSYSGPLFRRIATTTSSRAIGRLWVVRGLAVGAEALATRVALLRIVAWLSGAGMVLTFLELTYYGYCYFFEPDELQSWIKRCALRDASQADGTPFGAGEFDGEYELQELAKARQLVGV